MSPARGAIGVVAILLISFSPCTTFAAPALEGATRAMRQQRYVDAKREVDALRSAGNLTPQDLVESYALSGTLTAILEGPEAGEREFRKLLVLDPAHHPPAQSSPVIAEPFEKARAWVATNGALVVEHVPVEQATPGVDTPLAIRATNDPLAMVAGAVLHQRTGAGPFVTATGRSLAPSLQAAHAGEAIEYYVEVIDAGGNCLRSFGTARAPLAVRVGDPASAEARHSAAPRSSFALYGAAIGGGALSLVALGVAITYDVRAGNEFDALTARCAPGCTDLSTLHLNQQVATAFYATAGVAAAATIAVLITAGIRGRRR